MLTAMAMVGTAYFATFWEQRHCAGSSLAVYEHRGHHRDHAFYCAYAHRPRARRRRGLWLDRRAPFAVVGFFGHRVRRLESGSASAGAIVPPVFGAGGFWYACGEVPLIAVGFIYILERPPRRPDGDGWGLDEGRALATPSSTCRAPRSSPRGP